MLEPSPLHCSKPCPFCTVSFKGLGNYQKYCPQREGRDYHVYLSQKTESKLSGGPKKKLYPKCGRSYARLDTHLRLSATCRTVKDHLSQCLPQSQPLSPSCQTTQVCNLAPDSSTPDLLATAFAMLDLILFYHPQYQAHW